MSVRGSDEYYAAKLKADIDRATHKAGGDRFHRVLVLEMNHHIDKGKRYELRRTEIKSQLRSIDARRNDVRASIKKKKAHRKRIAEETDLLLALDAEEEKLEAEYMEAADKIAKSKDNVTIYEKHILKF
jgi:hypothetical protein